MVRVFKCHSFLSQHVIPISKEPLTISADHDKVFVATSDCEIVVFQINNGISNETHRCPTVSQVEKIVYSSFRNYIATIELKKSWKHVIRSVRLYLNWEVSKVGNSRPRTKVCVAGRSHAQHLSGASRAELLQIVEVPLDENATGLAVCRHTGNFAVACGSEVKLCSVVEKTVANSCKTYLDVEVFLELCWNFEVQAISLCEEFIVCCSQKEVHGIRVRYDEGEKRQHKTFSFSNSVGSHPLSPSAQDTFNILQLSPGAATPHSFISEAFMYADQMKEISAKTSTKRESAGLELKPVHRWNSDTALSATEFSVVGMKPPVQSQPWNSPESLEPIETSIIDDENFIEWDFQKSGTPTCLLGLHSSSGHTWCQHHTHLTSPPVLSDFSGSKVKSMSGVQAETVLHVSDLQEKEEWMSVLLIPSYSSELSTPMRIPSVSSDRMRSLSSVARLSMCCYISGHKGGYLYQISPHLSLVSSYKYTDKASQVGMSQSYLHVVTNSGIETYTSRWGVVSLEVQEKNEDATSIDKIHPPSSLDICLCGREPFFGAVTLSVGTDFLALLSKVEDPTGNEVQWGLYVLHTFNLVDTYNDMIIFAEKIRSTSPASYIHLLQEAHLLLSTSPECTASRDNPEVKNCLHQVCRLLGEHYAQPGQEEWTLCWPYYHNSGASLEDIVQVAVEAAEKHTPQEFGKGLLDCLDHIMFSQEEYVTPSASVCDAILNIYAVSAPEKLSQLILLSNLTTFSAEKAFNHLKSWVSVKARACQPISTIDRLATIKLQLKLCEVDAAISELNAIHKASLVDVCASNPALIHTNLTSFTPLAQLMRQHMAGTLLEALVEMLDRGVMSFDSLLTLLRSQSDASSNSHLREVLELILNDEKRVLLFEEAAQMLCEIYIGKLKEKTHPSPKQMNTATLHKFSLPHGNGHFAPRFAWLDYIPPFQGPSKMARPCQRLEVKQIMGQGSRNTPLSVAMVAKLTLKEKCQCIACNENLLKLQSLLCSTHLTSELTTFIMNLLDGIQNEDPGKVKDDDGVGECWESIQLLCITSLDWEKAVALMVDKFPSVVGMYAVCCFRGNLDKFSHLLRSLEAVMSSCDILSPVLGEDTYVKAYKDLLTRMAELFPPAQFLDLLPADGNLYFLLPFLCTNFKFFHAEKLKQKIVDMGKDLLTHN